MSIHTLIHTFKAWADQQVLTPGAAEHANFVLAYLRMDQPLPACLRAALAEHVEAIAVTYDTNTQPLVLSGFRQSALGHLDENKRQRRFGG